MLDIFLIYLQDPMYIHWHCLSLLRQAHKLNHKPNNLHNVDVHPIVEYNR